MLEIRAASYVLSARVPSCCRWYKASRMHDHQFESLLSEMTICWCGKKLQPLRQDVINPHNDASD